MKHCVIVASSRWPNNMVNTSTLWIYTVYLKRTNVVFWFFQQTVRNLIHVFTPCCSLALVFHVSLLAYMAHDQTLMADSLLIVPLCEHTLQAQFYCWLLALPSPSDLLYVVWPVHYCTLLCNKTYLLALLLTGYYFRLNKLAACKHLLRNSVEW